MQTYQRHLMSSTTAHYRGWKLIVNIIFEEEDVYYDFDHNVRNLTCYEHLKCDRGPIPMCLDWREVHDGKVDCLDAGAVGEAPCHELEINECQEKDEFRCHNGLCIAEVFFQDNFLDPDCLDCSDEPDTEMGTSNENCFQDPTFRCEDHVCRPGLLDFTCGDGHCIGKDDYCLNGRDIMFTNQY